MFTAGAGDGVVEISVVRDLVRAWRSHAGPRASPEPGCSAEAAWRAAVTEGLDRNHRTSAQYGPHCRELRLGKDPLWLVLDDAQGNHGYGCFGMNIGIENTDDDPEFEIIALTFDHGVDVFTVPGSEASCSVWGTGRGNLLRNAQGPATAP